MDRLVALEPSTLVGEQRRLYDDINEYFHVPYVFKLPNGQMVGPFGIELHTLGARCAWLGMTKSLGSIPELPLLAREVAILVTGFHEEAAYEIYAQTAVSKLPRADVEQVSMGKCPEHLDEACQVAFRMASELCKPGVLPLEVWEEGCQILSKPGAIAVVHYVGFYKYVATILNGFDAKVPGAQ